MCGIAGAIYTEPKKIDSFRAHRAFDSLKHRGPDMEGVLLYSPSCNQLVLGGRELLDTDSKAQVIFLHRRLSIIDLSEGGRQPMVSPDSRHALTYNGEIYNYKEIKDRLTSLGLTFRTNSDTEVLLYALAYHGIDALAQLIGMFAFAWLDAPMKRVYLVRDFFGIKPLYYAMVEDGVIFASQISTLYELHPLPKRVNPQILYDFLSTGITDHSEQTMFEPVKRVLPAHYLEIDLETGTIKNVRYWDVPYKDTIEVSFEEAVKRVRELFLESISLHLRSDVPVGTALSGGIDSSAIVHSIRYLQPNAEIHTLSFVAKDFPISEEKWIDIVVNSAQTYPHKVIIHSEELLEDIHDLVRTQEEPFGSTSIYAQYRVFQLASQNGIKVMLDGQGGDEIFAGYLYYLRAYWNQLISQRNWKHSLSILRAMTRMTLEPDWLRFTRLLSMFLPVKVRRNLTKKFHADWLNKKWFLERNVINYFSDMNERHLKRMLYDTLTRTSIPHLLRYEDLNSMRFSIESRVPFLNPKLVSYVFHLPESYLISENGVTKHIFRRAMEGILHPAILERQDKIGFATPQFAWLSNIVPRLREITRLQELPFLKCPNLFSTLEKMISHKVRVDNSVWRLINTVVWLDAYEISLGV